MKATGTTQDGYATWDAAYVLGSLSAAERDEYEAHLQACADCRSAVAELSGLPGLLSLVELSDVAALDGEQHVDAAPPATLYGSVVERVRRRRRIRAFTAGFAAVAAVLLAVALVIALLPRMSGEQRDTVPPSADGIAMSEVAQTPINATVELTGYGWGTRIDMACSYGDWGAREVAPQSLGMVVIGHDGSRAQIATWLGISGATALPSATTPLQPHEIAAVQLVSADSGKVLLEKQI